MQRFKASEWFLTSPIDPHFATELYLKSQGAIWKKMLSTIDNSGEEPIITEVILTCSLKMSALNYVIEI